MVLEASCPNLLRLGILLMMTYMMKHYKIKVKLLLKTKFSIFSSVNTKFQDYSCPVFPSLLTIVHLTLDRGCLEISFGNALYLLYLSVLWELTDRALGWGGVWRGGSFLRVRGVCCVL